MEIDPSPKEPRKESPGEQIERYAAMIGGAAGSLGLKLVDADKHSVAKFAVDVARNLSESDKKAIAAHVAAMLKAIIEAQKQ